MQRSVRDDEAEVPHTDVHVYLRLPSRCACTVSAAYVCAACAASPSQEQCVTVCDCVRDSFNHTESEQAARPCCVCVRVVYF